MEVIFLLFRSALKIIMSKKLLGPNLSSNEKENLIHLVTKYRDVGSGK